MSVAGISSNMISPYLQGSGSAPTTRQAEDIAARQLIQDLQSDNLTGAQADYSKLAAFGPNNSGPWQGGAMANDFQALGQALQSGDLAGAKSAATSLAKDQLASDVNAAHQDFQAGNMAAYQQAVKNYEGDYWAVFGMQPQTQPPTGGSQNAGGLSTLGGYNGQVPVQLGTGGSQNAGGLSTLGGYNGQVPVQMGTGGSQNAGGLSTLGGNTAQPPVQLGTGGSQTVGGLSTLQGNNTQLPSQLSTGGSQNPDGLTTLQGINIEA